MFLTKQELRELTGCIQRNSQARALNSMGLSYKIRPDGQVIVLRKHIFRELEGQINPAKILKKVEPNWEGLNA